MRKLEYYWMSNKEWYHLTENMHFVVNDDAPKEAKESYERYLKELRERPLHGVLEVKYLGTLDTPELESGGIYDVIRIENGLYRIYTELFEEKLFSPEHFEIVDDDD